ncbi:RNA polymerase sigma factor [Segatella paludivivens]|uniref:RNA polymerase sigma factor n=1 Tax=Segatella paludivivens TaxID=185294 RepID=UPI0005C51B1E|nr:RNA polymerase sigma factor [Segatella paludivivens]
MDCKIHPEVKIVYQRQISSRDDADDILQDVFYQLAKNVDNAMNPIENISAWLYRVTQNKIINAETKKKEVRMPVFQEDEDENVLEEISGLLFHEVEDEDSPETKYLRSLVWTELENALAELPPEQREIFEMTELDGIPVKEISKTIGVPVNTLLSRKHYAIVYLRKRLQTIYNDLIST